MCYSPLPMGGNPIFYGSMISGLTKRDLVLCAALAGLVALHLSSLCTFVRYYAHSFVFEFGQGCAVLYWGGDGEFRNICVYNAGEWPLSPETHFAGSSLAEGQRWEAYGPWLELDHRWFSERIQYRGLLRALGYSLPRYRHEARAEGGPKGEHGASSALLPLGTVAFIAEAAGLLLAWKPNRAAAPKRGGGVSHILRHSSFRFWARKLGAQVHVSTTR